MFTLDAGDSGAAFSASTALALVINIVYVLIVLLYGLKLFVNIRREDKELLLELEMTKQKGLKSASGGKNKGQRKSTPHLHSRTISVRPFASQMFGKKGNNTLIDEKVELQDLSGIVTAADPTKKEGKKVLKDARTLKRFSMKNQKRQSIMSKLGFDENLLNAPIKEESFQETNNNETKSKNGTCGPEEIELTTMNQDNSDLDESTPDSPAETKVVQVVGIVKTSSGYVPSDDESELEARVSEEDQLPSSNPNESIRSVESPSAVTGTDIKVSLSQTSIAASDYQIDTLHVCPAAAASAEEEVLAVQVEEKAADSEVTPVAAEIEAEASAPAVQVEEKAADSEATPVVAQIEMEASAPAVQVEEKAADSEATPVAAEIEAENSTSTQI